MEKPILIAENDDPVADALLRRLSARGYAPERAVDAEAALSRFNAGQPQLVVVSLTLPDDGARRLVGSLRARPRGALVPILLLGTGDEAVRTPGEAIAAGADHFFRKPGGVDALLDKIATFIGPGDTGPTAGERPATPTGGPAWDQPTERRFGGDDGPGDEPTFEDAGLGAGPVTFPPPQASPSRAEPALPDATGQGWTDAQAPAPDPQAIFTDVLQPGRAVLLERRGLADVLAAAAAVRFTGRVEVAASGVLRRVFLDTGRPVYADSSADGEDLCAWLAAEGYVARAALARARARAAQVGTAPEEILMEAGYLQADDVWRALHGHVVHRVLDLFGVEAGEALVVQGGPRPIDPVDLGMHPGRLILDGLRRKFGRLRLYRVFGTPALIPRPVGQIRPEGLVLRTDEEAVLHACDGRRTAIEVARTARVNEVDALAILHGLAVLGFIEPPSGRPRAGALPPLDTRDLERAGAPRTADALPGFADLVSTKLSEVQTADYFQVLGVPRTASNAELRAAWETLRRRFDPHRVRRDGPLWHQVQEIASVVEDAWHMLSDARLRARYERAVG